MGRSQQGAMKPVIDHGRARVEACVAELGEVLAAHVVVEGVPLVDEAVVVEVQQVREKGRRISQHRTVTTATDKSSGVSVRLTGDLTPVEMEPIGADFLAAEVRFRGSPAGDGNEKPVRRYVMHPAQSAKDLRTGVTQHNLKKLWSGKIDEFLLSFIDSPLNESQA